MISAGTRKKLELESRSPELHENKFSIRVTPKEVTCLRSELEMNSEDDQRLAISPTSLLLVILVHSLC